MFLAPNVCFVSFSTHVAYMRPGLIVYVTMPISPLGPFLYGSLAVGAGGVRSLRFRHGSTTRISVYRDKASIFAPCLKRYS